MKRRLSVLLLIGSAASAAILPRGFTILSRSGWTATASSAFNGSFVASNVLDGNWATEWDTNGSFPGTLTIDMGSLQTVASFILYPRGNHSSAIKDWTLYTSTDCSSYSSVASGTWDDNLSTRVIRFASASVQCVRLSAANSWRGEAGAAEVFMASGSMWSVTASTTYGSDASDETGCILQTCSGALNYWASLVAAPPHTLIIDFGESKTFTAILWTQSGAPGNYITAMAAYASNDCSTWGASIGSDTFAGSGDKSLTVSSTTASCVKLNITGTAGGSGAAMTVLNLGVPDSHPAAHPYIM